jgi:AAA family ATP:ADP antiporter
LTSEHQSPLTKWLGKSARIEADETAAVITAFLLFFCVLGGYFAVRPVRETVGTVLGADRVSDLYVVTWISSLALVPAYGALCARFPRRKFLPWIYGFVALALATCAIVFRQNEGNLAAGQFFYVLISVVNLFVVSVFWSFLLELFNTGQTKRLFGFIAAGGTAGALAGPLLTDLLVSRVGLPGILFGGSGMFILAILLQRNLLRIAAKTQWKQGDEVSLDRPLGGNPFAGFTLVLKSPYLLGIALFVVLLASVNTFLYFEQLRVVSETFADTETRTRVFSRIDYTVQSLTIVSQLFLTGRLAQRWGVGVLLTAIPIAMVGGFLMLAAFQTFTILAIVMITRRFGEYAFVRPGREMLWSRVDTETKYKAKNFADVPVYRGGDALAAQVSTALDNAGLSPSRVAVIGAGVAAAWAINGWLLGRRKEPVPAVAGAH